MKRLFGLFSIAIFLNSFLYAQNSDAQAVIKKTEILINEIAAKSYPEIKPEKIKVKIFKSDSNFFKARFSCRRFFAFQKMRHIIYVNPEVYKKNAEGIRGIIAHELAHILYYTEKNRLELLGLARLSSKSFTTKFERKADLEAIKRGYGKELIEYREWLYKNVPAEKSDNKKRDYFTPEEIRILIPALEKDSQLFEELKDDIPLNFEELQNAIL